MWTALVNVCPSVVGLSQPKFLKACWVHIVLWNKASWGWVVCALNRCAWLTVLGLEESKGVVLTCQDSQLCWKWEGDHPRVWKEIAKWGGLACNSLAQSCLGQWLPPQGQHWPAPEQGVPRLESPFLGFYLWKLPAAMWTKLPVKKWFGGENVPGA